MIYYLFCEKTPFFDNEKIINDILVLLTNLFEGGFFNDQNILPKDRLNVIQVASRGEIMLTGLTA